jgi:hypothetical protein
VASSSENGQALRNTRAQEREAIAQAIPTPSNAAGSKREEDDALQGASPIGSGGPRL